MKTKIVHVIENKDDKLELNVTCSHLSYPKHLFMFSGLKMESIDPNKITITYHPEIILHPEVESDEKLSSDEVAGVFKEIENETIIPAMRDSLN